LNMQNDEIIASWSIDGRNVWRITLGQLNGEPIFHIRQWYPASGGDYLPGTRGVAMGTRQLGKLLSALEKLRSQAESKNFPLD